MTAGDVDVRLTQNRGFNCNIFDGVDDYVEIPHNANQLGANLSNGFTISAWINPKSIGEADAGTIIDKSSGANGANGFWISSESVATPRLTIRLNNGTQRTSGNSTLSYGFWQHFLLTISSAQIASWYKNGVATGVPGDLVQTISTITTTNAMRIGNLSTATTRTFNGGIRDVKMWNRVLTTTEIGQDYAGITPENGLIHYFKLGGDYADYGSVGATATNSGSVAEIVDDQIATAVKAQKALMSVSGAYMICRGKDGQVMTVAVQET